MVTLDDIRGAAEQIRPHVKRTPVLTSPALDERLGAAVFCKAEHLQEAGAFKSRGACNAVFLLSDDEARRGVVTHSSGNHAAALSRAAAIRGINAHIVMPEGSRQIKVDAVRRFGGHITFCEPTLEARETTAARVLAETGGTFIHPYDDERIIAGQGTAALELLDEIPNLDVIIAPVGGGGLLSGTAIVARSHDVTIWGAEPAGADDAFRSLNAKRLIPQTDPRTMADGLRTSLGEKTFPIIAESVERILLASEEAIAEMTRWVLHELGWRVEPSGCVPLAALLEERARSVSKGQQIGVILSGGNFNPSEFE